jgi:hypothetical protein
VSAGLAPSVVDTAREVLATGEGNTGLALLVLLADEQDRTHKHHFRRPTDRQRRRLGLDARWVRSYCFACHTKRGHDGSTWVG